MHRYSKGTHDASGHNGHHSAYDGSWWRFEAEVHWEATVFRDSFRVGSTGGAIPLRNNESDDTTVRRSIEAFVETSEQPT